MSGSSSESESGEDGGDYADSDLTYVMSEDQLEDGQRAIVQIQGKEIAIMRLEDEYHAVLNFCIHQGGPVCRGPRSGTITSTETEEGWELEYSKDGRIISCPWHGWEFDICTGEHEAPTDYEIPTYPVVVRDGGIYVAL